MIETFYERKEASLALKQRAEHSEWSSVTERLIPEAWPSLKPSFKAPPGAKIFTIGSCFARNIEEHLALLGYRLPTLDFGVPEQEWRGLRRNGILNKYTPATVCQEIEWAAGIYERGTGFVASDADPMRFETKEGQIVDLHLGGFIPVSEERFVARRKEIYVLYEEAFSADLVALTYGLTESWVNRNTGLHVHQAPATRQMIRAVNDYDFVNLDYEASLAYMRRAVETLRRLNPDSAIITTVSPVALGTTFTGHDVILANSLSKSTLRAATGKLETLYEKTDYFPSYENATLSMRTAAFESDLRHVRDGFVGQIVKRLIAQYFDVPDTLAELVQSAAVALGSKLTATETKAYDDLAKAKPALALLSDDQLNVYLRVLWRIRDKRGVGKIGAEIMNRDARLHRHLRAMSLIFPRCGLEIELRRYARDVLALDPSNSLARKWVDESVPGST